MSFQLGISYCLNFSDKGIIKTIEKTVYLTHVYGKSLYCLDREAKVIIEQFDPTEYRFKLALINREFDQVVSIIKNSNLVGQSIISYLREKGYPDVNLLSN
jgi:coatomer protein complex subunit alpha (xenin)